MGHDGDSFNRWEAGQTLGRALILAAYEGTMADGDAAAYATALRQILDDASVDDAFKALMLVLPGESEIAAALGADVDTDKVHAARDGVRTVLGRYLLPDLETVWQRTEENGPYSPDPASTARRALRQAALALMALGDRERGIARALAELETPAQHECGDGRIGRSGAGRMRRARDGARSLPRPPRAVNICCCRNG